MKLDYMYYWRLEFEDGEILDQIRNNSFPKNKRIDPNNPPKKVKYISLCARKEDIVEEKGLPSDMGCDIKDGCKPIYYRSKIVTNMGMGQTIGLVFKFGCTGDRLFFIDVINNKYGVIKE